MGRGSTDILGGTPPHIMYLVLLLPPDGQPGELSMAVREVHVACSRWRELAREARLRVVDAATLDHPQSAAPTALRALQSGTAFGRAFLRDWRRVLAYGRRRRPLHGSARRRGHAYTNPQACYVI